MSKLLVFCIDALCSSDVERMRSMPHFGPLLERGAVAERVEPVFPALTYTCHTSILTGTRAGAHGIWHNEHLARGARSGLPWFTDRRDVRGETLLDRAREAGLTTCSLSWPVSAHADLTMNAPMIVPYDYKGWDPARYFADGAGTDNLFERYFYRHGRHLMGPERSLDLYTMGLALDIIDDGDQADVMLVKLCDLDSARHAHGVYSQQAYDTLRRHDEELGSLMEAMRRAGTLDDTDIVIVGDHGQTDIEDVLLLNELFLKNGLIEMGEDGTVERFEAYVHSTGLCALVEVGDPEDEAMVARVRAFLDGLQDDERIALSYVYGAREMRERFGIWGPFDFAIESRRPIAFGDALGSGEVWGSKIPGDHIVGAATHGGSPERAEGTAFIACGPDVRPARLTDPVPMVDEAPTMAALLGLTMPGAEGSPLKAMLSATPAEEA